MFLLKYYFNNIKQSIWKVQLLSKCSFEHLVFLSYHMLYLYNCSLLFHLYKHPHHERCHHHMSLTLRLPRPPSLSYPFCIWLMGWWRAQLGGWRSFCSTGATFLPRECTWICREREKCHGWEREKTSEESPSDGNWIKCYFTLN